MILHPGLLYFFSLSIEDLKFTRHSIYFLLNLSFFFKILQLSLLTFLFNKSLPALFLIWDFFLFLIRLRSDYCPMYKELLKILPAYQFLRNLRSIS